MQTADYWMKNNLKFKSGSLRVPLFSDFNNSVRCSGEFTVEEVYWQKDLKISGYSDAYDAIIGNYSRTVTSSPRSAMIINLGKDKTVCVLVNAAGN